ncbi:hypothetical protein X801_04829, partial [Opisthorchis viverrini]
LSVHDLETPNILSSAIDKKQACVVRSSFSCVNENFKGNLRWKLNHLWHFPVRKALDDHPVREIRFQKDDSNKSDLLIVVYMDPEKFLNLSKSYGQSDLLDNTFEDTLNERLAALSPSRVNPIACTQDRIYLQAHGICPKGGEFVFIGQNSTSTKLSVCLWSALMLLLITCCW